MTRAIARLAPTVLQRSQGRCEAVRIGQRCLSPAEEIHHRIPRSRASFRGDHLLDLAGHTHHLAHLCRSHHRWAHEWPTWARDARLWDGRVGLTVGGSIARLWNGALVYRGDSEEFAIYDGGDT